MSSTLFLSDDELKPGVSTPQTPFIVARASFNIRRALGVAALVVCSLFLLNQFSSQTTVSLIVSSQASPEADPITIDRNDKPDAKAREQEVNSFSQAKLVKTVGEDNPDTPTPTATAAAESSIFATPPSTPIPQKPAETPVKPTNATSDPTEVPVKPVVNVVFAFRDRLPRLVNLLSRLERISTDYGDTQFRVIVSDYDSPPKTVEATRYILNSWTHETGIEVNYVNVPVTKQQDASKGVTFNKALTIVHGVNLVTNEDDIVLICDVDMYLPLNVFDVIRENCEKGARFYAPVCFSLTQPADGIDQYLGAGERRTPGRKTESSVIEKASLGKDSRERQPGRGLGFWRHSGYGNVAVYKYDWNRVGDVMGQFINQSKWGHEDLHIFGELNKKLKAERKELRGFYHLWHPRAEWQVDNGEHKGVL